MGIFSSPLPLAVAVGGVWHLFVVELFGVWVAGGTSRGTELSRAQGTLLTPKIPGWWGGPVGFPPHPGSAQVRGKLHG